MNHCAIDLLEWEAGAWVAETGAGSSGVKTRYMSDDLNLTSVEETYQETWGEVLMASRSTPETVVITVRPHPFSCGTPTIAHAARGSAFS